VTWEAPLVEALAEYFEAHNMGVVSPANKEKLKQKLDEGRLEPLGVLLGAPEATFELIDVLLEKDAEKFKDFFVLVTQAKAREDLEKIYRAVYKSSAQKPAKEVPAEAVTKAFLRFQTYMKEDNYEALWGLYADNLRSGMFQSDFQRFKEELGSDEAKTIFLGMHVESVAKCKGDEVILEEMPNAELFVLNAKYENQAWKFFFIDEDGQWKICEGQHD
jgi:hypothetical protein